jgi:hypothetical protein
MRNQHNRIQRQGQIYRFSVNGAEYAAFIWQLGVQFQGRIEGQPQVPQCTGRSALAVRVALERELALHARA